jgi:hypothetical protein
MRVLSLLSLRAAARRPRAALCGAILLAAASAPAMAQTGFYLPTSTPPAGQDEFRSADGTSCKTTMDGARRVELGAFGSGGRDDQRNSLYALPDYGRSPSNSSLGVYGRYVMSLDAPSQRMDCSKLYELELERRRLEVELMRRNLTGADERLDAMASRRRVVTTKPREAAPRARRKGKATRSARAGGPPI